LDVQQRFFNERTEKDEPVNEISFSSLRNPSLIERIRKSLLDRIIDGRFTPGERLPSEPELAGMLGVSRNSLREAITLLENEGFLSRRKGVGTFITHSTPIIKGGIERLKGIADFIKERGYIPGNIIEKIENEKCDEAIAIMLGLEPGELFTVIETVKTASGKRVASCNDFIPCRYLQKPLEKAGFKDSIFEILKMDHGINITFAECDLIATISDDSLASKLSMKTGSPVLLLEQIHYSDKGEKVLFSRSFFPSDKFTFKLIRKR
jgi:GntR family transcriptional regulator